MAYSLDEAKELIIKAGLELVKEKLIARTWGNISARISANEFVITPSGVPYDQVNKDNLVVVKIEDCSYEGNVKPSGEKKVHAAIYKIRDDVNFILHTHQNYATAISADGLDKEFAPNAKYGLSGTKKLTNNVAKAIKNNPNFQTFLMARHGAVIISSNYEDAFNKARELETKAKEYFDKFATEKSEKILNKPYLDDYAQMFGYGKEAVEEDKEAVELVKFKNALAGKYLAKPKPIGRIDVFLQHLVYKKKYSKLKDKNK